MRAENKEHGWKFITVYAGENNVHREREKESHEERKGKVDKERRLRERSGNENERNNKEIKEVHGRDKWRMERERYILLDWK